MDDLGGFDLPQRGAFRIVLAGFAGRVCAALESRGLSLGPLGAGGREAGRERTSLLNRGLNHPERVDEAALEVVRQLESVAGCHGPVGVRQPGIALGEDAAGVAVIGDPVGLQGTALVVHLDVAGRGDGVPVVVVDDFLGVDEKAVLARACLGARADGLVQGRLGEGRHRPSGIE